MIFSCWFGYFVYLSYFLNCITLIILKLHLGLLSTLTSLLQCRTPFNKIFSNHYQHVGSFLVITQIFLLFIFELLFYLSWNKKGVFKKWCFLAVKIKIKKFIPFWQGLKYSVSLLRSKTSLKRGMLGMTPNTVWCWGSSFWRSWEYGVPLHWQLCPDPDWSFLLGSHLWVKDNCVQKT